MTATATATTSSSGTDKVIPLLEVADLNVEFKTRGGTVKVLDQVGFTLARRETIGVVGESGSGKSVLSFAIMGILDRAGRIPAGTIKFEGADLLRRSPRELDQIRGRDMAMIFQNPRVALNPIRSVGDQLMDVLRRHGDVPRDRLRTAAIEALAKVKIPDPERRAAAYPFELSGGMCQRVMIAIAISCQPKLLIADEPTTGLDVTTQRSIMDLVRELAVRNHMATMLITHDLGLAAEYCDRILVMHAGHVVEDAPTAELFRHPRHPYTARLIATTPRPGTVLSGLAPIPGGLPDLRSTNLPPCRYRERCERRLDLCDQPPLCCDDLGDGHRVACRNPLP